MSKFGESIKMKDKIIVMLLMCFVDGIYVLIHRKYDASFDASLSNGFSKEVVEAQNLVREYLKG